MVVITGNVQLTTPAVTNVKRIVYKWTPDTYEPQTVMGTVLPVGFKRPHKWVLGEVHVLSEAKAVMDTYVKNDAANVAVTMVATQTDNAGIVWTYTFTGCVFLNEQMTVADDEDVITVYPFVAQKVAATHP
jgi:hypothetical protein